METGDTRKAFSVVNQGSDPHNNHKEDEQRPGQRAPSEENPVEKSGSEEPDVLLDIPVLNVEEIDLEVEDLRAHVSVRAELASFVSINIGVDAYLNHLKLRIKGVEAQAQLKVRLDKILGTLDKALDALQANPDLMNKRDRTGETDDHPQSRNTERDDRNTGQTQPPMPGIPDASEAPLELEEGSGPVGDDTPEISATDAARRKAEELGVDLSLVEATGSGGRILVGDVKRAAKG